MCDFLPLSQKSSPSDGIALYWRLCCRSEGSPDVYVLMSLDIMGKLCLRVMNWHRVLGSDSSPRRCPEWGRRCPEWGRRTDPLAGFHWPEGSREDSRRILELDLLTSLPCGATMCDVRFLTTQPKELSIPTKSKLTDFFGPEETLAYQKKWGRSRKKLGTEPCLWYTYQIAIEHLSTGDPARKREITVSADKRLFLLHRSQLKRSCHRSFWWLRLISRIPGLCSVNSNRWDRRIPSKPLWLYSFYSYNKQT